MTDLNVAQIDREAFELAQAKTSDGIDVALLIVTGTQDVAVPLGSICAISAGGKFAGDERLYRAFEPQTRLVLEHGEPLADSDDQLQVLIVRVG